MELGDKFKDLKLTEEEMGRFTNAFKDENFRKMLRDYAEEISEPENRRRYEEEIAILEQERGKSVEFIHPTPFRCIKTSIDGKLKGYLNICGNNKIGKPSSKIGVSEDGTRGLHWSLPHSLHPERKELDSKGNKILIYDVIFHPDTLHVASSNTRFMNMVTSVAIQAVQDAFKVSLNRKNVKVMSTKYKGSPQACVIRKPIPGFEAKEVKEDKLAFPYPDDKKEETKICKSHTPPKTKEPTVPHYSLKYRSIIDLQDFRCSRDSAQSPRPKEIVITIDLPLLKSVVDTNLEVKEKGLLLESVNPAYRLELALAYAVDEDRGEAKFNRQIRQMVVTLPVRPSKEQLQFSGCIREEDWNVQEDGERKNGEGVDIRTEAKTNEDELEKINERKQEEVAQEVDEKEHAEVSQGHGEAELSEEREDGAKMVEQRSVTGESEEEGQVRSKKETERDEVEELHRREEEGGAKEVEKEDIEVSQCDSKAKMRKKKEDGAKMEEQEKSVTVEKKIEWIGRTKDCRKEEENKESQDENEYCPEMSSSKCQGDVESWLDTEVQLYEDTEEAHSQQSTQAPVCPKKAETIPCDVNKPEPVRTMEKLDEDDLNSEQHFEKPRPPVVNLRDTPRSPVVNLREKNQDGTETPITDHVTSAGFTFKNSLLFELD